MISVPPPTRIPIASITVDGKRMDIFLNIEWARFFETLSAQSASNVASLSNLAAAAIMGSLGDGGDASEAAVLLPGQPGQPGAQGAPGPALYLLQEPETNDVFWPVSTN